MSAWDNYEIARSDYARGLATVRKRLGKTQREVAEIVGHTQRDISSWENCRTRIPDGIAQWLAIQLFVDIREIYNVVDDEGNIIPPAPDP